MRRAFLFALLFALLAPSTRAASSQELKPFIPEFHGYATQSFIYSNQNNWDTTNSTHGSLAWSEAVVNANAVPMPRLRFGAQARYFRLGTYGNNVSLDWASVEFKLNEHFGIRAGKVKTPIGLLNETQDVDPAHLWILLPQVIYPVESRTALLADYGGVVFGTVSLGRHLGKIEYRGYGGKRSVPAGDGYFDPLKSSGFTVPNGLTGLTYGGVLHWKTPLPGLTVGASRGSERVHGAVAQGSDTGTLNTAPFTPPFVYAQYEHSRFMLAGEYRRFAAVSVVNLGWLQLADAADERSFYVMASYKIAPKLTAGAYFGSEFNVIAPLGSDRFSKDWTVSARYDFNPALYLKAEQHFIDGTLVGYSSSNNPDGLAPTSRLSLLKLGVTF